MNINWSFRFRSLACASYASRAPDRTDLPPSAGAGGRTLRQVPGSLLLGMWPRSLKGGFPLTDKPCQLNRSMQHPSNLVIRWGFSKGPDLLGCTRLDLNRAVFFLNQRSRMNLAIEIPADRTSGECCVDPLRPPGIIGMWPKSS